MSIKNDQNLSELRFLLKLKNVEHSHFDLEEGFLNDFHRKIRMDEMKISQFTVIREKIECELQQFLGYFYGRWIGLALSVITIGVLLLSFNRNQNQEEFAKKRYEGKLSPVKSDSEMNYSTKIPTYTFDKQDF